MAVRYNALSLVSGNPDDTTTYKLGDLDSLLSWNLSDPRDDFEMYRNNYIYTWQLNRNPFIDMPELASYIYGNNVGQIWYNPTTIRDIVSLECTLYPNPAHHMLTIEGIKGEAIYQIYTLQGQLVSTSSFVNETKVPLQLAKGIYPVKIIAGKQLMVKKILVE
jgi:hypothetical protein